MSEEFEILKIRKTDGTGGIKGFADLRVGPITILGIKIIEGKGEIFCALPSENFFSRSAGRQLNRAVVHLRDDLRSRIYEEILSRWSELEELKFKNEEGQ